MTLHVDAPMMVFIVLSAFAWAKLEIEIEGKDGWASNLPTWRVKKKPIFDFVYGGADITGYHVWAFSFLLLMFHLPFFWNGEWSWRAEGRAFGAYTLFWILEDFLWFILNPHFGLKGLNPEKAWWHRRWLLGLPTVYWTSGATGALLFFFL